MVFRMLHSYPKRLGDSTINTLGIRNLKRRFIEIFEVFWFPIAKVQFFRRIVLCIIGLIQLRNNESIVRNLLTRTLPWNPLLNKQGPPIDIFCLVAEKDLELLSFTLPSVLNTSTNPVENFYVVAPESLKTKILETCNDLGLPFQILSDESLLDLFNIESNIFTYGHPKMLILKYLCALFSDLDDVLVVDGDTVFLKPRQWLSFDKKLIVVSQELHNFHLDYCKRFFSIDSRHNLGFTTQSQILSKSDIEAIALYMGGITELAINFSEVYNDFHSAINKHYFPAEWQLACEWSTLFNKRESVFGNYSNLSFSRNLFFEFMGNYNFESYDVNCHHFLRRLVPSLGSISLHDYK